MTIRWPITARKTLLATSILAAACLSSAARADRLLVDIQNNSPNRVAIFSDDYATDSTPVGPDLFGPVRNQTLEVTMVFEAPDQPYYTYMDLEFRCPNPSFEPKKGKSRKGGAAEWVLPEVDSVEFRMIRGSKKMKNVPKPIPLAPTDWQRSEAYSMKRVYRIACNDDAIDRAKRSSPAADGKTINMAVLRQKLAAIGLQNAEYVPEGTFCSMLADFTWETLWPDAKKPVVDYGPPLTVAEKEKLKTDIAALGQKIESHKAEVEGRLSQMKGEMDFTADAAKFRGNRKWTRVEQSMNIVWQSKTERDIVAALGPPSITDAGGVRFLSYGQDYDNRVIMRNVVTGAERIDGVYQSCNVRFALIPDSRNVLRVADVVVSAYSSSGSGTTTRICSGILEVPR